MPGKRPGYLGLPRSSGGKFSLERSPERLPLISSTKSLIGHTIGASGALEALVPVMSLKEQRTHACNNLDEPLTDLNFAREATSTTMDAALTQSFAFGGHNAGLVLKRFV